MNVLPGRHTEIAGTVFQGRTAANHLEIRKANSLGGDEASTVIPTLLSYISILFHSKPLWGVGGVSKSLRCLLSFSLPFAKWSVENDIRKQATFLFTPLFFPAPNPVHPQRTLAALDAGAQRGLRKGRKRRIA